MQDSDPDFLYKYYVLDWTDGPDIPYKVKQFAYDNNCFYILKTYYWSSKLFKDKGGVYFCGINRKVQYIYDYKDEIRFAKWYEKRKFKEVIYEF